MSAELCSLEGLTSEDSTQEEVIANRTYDDAEVLLRRIKDEINAVIDKYQDTSIFIANSVIVAYKEGEEFLIGTNLRGFAPDNAVLASIEYLQQAVVDGIKSNNRCAEEKDASRHQG